MVLLNQWYGEREIPVKYYGGIALYMVSHVKPAPLSS
jgi:hypothetical protein